MTNQPFEIIETTKPNIKCDGGESGHPLVFLHIDENTGEVTCPYCSKLFRLIQSNAA